MKKNTFLSNATGSGFCEGTLFGFKGKAPILQVLHVLGTKTWDSVNMFYI